MKTLTEKIIFILSLSFILTGNNLIYGKTMSPSIFDVLITDEITSVTISLDLKTILSKPKNEQKYPAIFSYKDSVGNINRWDINLKLRGKFRRMNCEELPPLKLYFDKDVLKTKKLSKYNDLKLVNYCHEEEILAKELIIKEFLAYKMYNQLTSESYRVHLLDITYKDIFSSKIIKQWGFVIEDTAQLRNRIGAQKIKEKILITDTVFNNAQIQLVALFQFMIGNSDWHLTYSHNVKLMKKGTKLIAIPFDFDFSGLVNAPYAIPNPNYDIKTLKDRVYLGFEQDIKYLDATYKIFLKNRDQLFELIKKNKHLTRSTKRKSMHYLKSFYKKMDHTYVVNSLPNNLNREATIRKNIAIK